MATPVIDFTQARDLMVDGQLRPNKVTDRRILDAMRTLPRERFVPPSSRATAYLDDDLPLGDGRALLAPMVLARLLQLADPRAGEAALVVAAGSGYGAAVLASLGVRVTALEPVPALAALGRALCQELAPGVTFEDGALADGAPDQAPFALIVIEGAVREIPAAYAAQLAPNGRLVGIVAPAGGQPYAAIAEHSGSRLVARAAFDANARHLPGLMPVPAFTF